MLGPRLLGMSLAPSAILRPELVLAAPLLPIFSSLQLPSGSLLSAVAMVQEGMNTSLRALALL